MVWDRALSRCLLQPHRPPLDTSDDESLATTANQIAPSDQFIRAASIPKPKLEFVGPAIATLSSTDETGRLAQSVAPRRPHSLWRARAPLPTTTQQAVEDHKHSLLDGID